MRFADRTRAGEVIARRLVSAVLDDPVVVALPRGGVPVAVPIAETLHAPLDVLVVRKLGHPRQRELGVGAVAEGGIRVLDDRSRLQLGIGLDAMASVEPEERLELARRVARYRAGRSPVPVLDRTVVLVDDGLATGVTARAAIAALRQAGAGRIVLAVPVGAESTVEDLRAVADEIECPLVTPHLGSVGAWYHDFSEVSDGEVVDALAARRLPDPPTAPATPEATGSATADDPALRWPPAGTSGRRGLDQ